MSIDFHRLMEPIDINRLIFIDYIDYIDCFPLLSVRKKFKLKKKGSTELPLSKPRACHLIV